MTDLLSATLLFVAMLGASWASHAALPYLPTAHRSRETMAVVGLVSNLTVTFAALVLGLLLASVNTAFFNSGNDMNALAASLRRTDACLRAYGPETASSRHDLRRYAVSVVATTWPEEQPPPAAAVTPPDAGAEGVDSPVLGNLLEGVRLAVLRLDPPDEAARGIAALCAKEMARLLDDRWKLIAEAQSTVSPPFFRVLALMLIVVFACFGLNAPRNALAWTTVGLAAFMIAAAVFVMLELDGPLDGLIKVSSAGMRAAAAELDR